MSQPLRLFQDAAGTIPANNIGDPVGKVIRAAGNYDLEQSTTLSRPSIGRWPKGAKPRNLLLDTENALSGLYVTSVTNAGVTAVRSVVDGVARYTLSGTPTTDQTVTLSGSNIGSGAYLSGIGDYTASIEARFIEGADKVPAGNYGIRIGAVGRTHPSNAYIEGGTVMVPTSSSWVRKDYPRTFTNTSFDKVTLSLQFGFKEGVSVDGIVIELRKPQIERGLNATPYQPTDADGVPLAGYGAVRNLANGAQAVWDSNYWPRAALVSNGVTREFVGSGVDEDGFEYADYRYHGTPTNATSASMYIASASAMIGEVGRSYRVALEGKITSGTLPQAGGPNGIRSSVVEGSSAGGGWKAATVGNIIFGSEYGTTEVIRTFQGVDGAPYVYLGTELRVAVGTTFDVTIRVRKLVFEIGSTATPFQHNYGPNNVTEQGVEDVVFLYNDGNDSFNRTLPVGTYYIASVNVAGIVKYETFAGGSLNYLRQERTVDVIVRSTPFTDKDKEVIEKMWSKYTL